MSSDDRFDEELRRIAHASVEGRAAEVDVTAALDEHRARTQGPRPTRIRNGRWFAAAAAVFVVAVGIAAIAWPRGADAPDIVMTDTATTPPPTDSAVAVTTQPEEPSTSAPTSTSTTISADTTTTSMTSTIDAITVDGPPCESEPLTPPSLVDGAPPGIGVVEQREGGRIVRWGGDDSPFAVSLSLGFPIDTSWIDNAVAADRAIAAGDWQATTVAVGDPPISSITIYLRNTADGCLRAYNVGPGLYSDQAETLADNWVTTLSTGEPIAPVGHTEIGADYFGRRITPLDSPFFEIDEISANGTAGPTLDGEQVTALFERHSLSDGTTVALEGVRFEARCANRPLVQSGRGIVDEARSIVTTATGTLFATRDVCPTGTLWGDDGTFSELVQLDLTSGGSAATLRTWPSDPDQIVLDDGVRVIAFGEQTISAASLDGRYVSLREQRADDSARWSVLDLGNDATTLLPASGCERDGDALGPVGPPRFLDENIVVLARTCATDLLVEVIDLAAQSPGGSIVWSRPIPGLAVDEFTQTVDLSARRLDDGTIWAIVAGNGGFDISSQSYAVSDDDVVEITRLGYQVFAFQPDDLITPFDTPPI